MNENPFQLDVVSIRLVKDAPMYSDAPLNCPEKAVELLGKELSEMDREVICIINVTSKNVPINCTYASVGVLNSAVAVPRELLKASILSNAAGVIMLHNHPSGDPTPSREDLKITARVSVACEYLGFDLLDHIIVGGRTEKYYSFNENHILQNAVTSRQQVQKSQNEMEKELVATERGGAR